MIHAISQLQTLNPSLSIPPVDNTVNDEESSSPAWLYAVIGGAVGCCCCLLLLIALIVFFTRGKNDDDTSTVDEYETATALSTFDGESVSMAGTIQPGAGGIYTSTDIPMYQSLPAASTQGGSSEQGDYGRLDMNAPDYQQLQLTPASNQFQ